MERTVVTYCRPYRVPVEAVEPRRSSVGDAERRPRPCPVREPPRTPSERERELQRSLSERELVCRVRCTQAETPKATNAQMGRLNASEARHPATNAAPTATKARETNGTKSGLTPPKLRLLQAQHDDQIAGVSVLYLDIHYSLNKTTLMRNKSSLTCNII